MFGSEVVDAFVHAELATLPEVTAAVGTRIASIEIVPASMALPAGLHHVTSSTYGDYGGDEELGYTIRFICEGTSTNPIREAAAAQKQHFAPANEAGTTFQYTYEGEHYTLSFTADGEAIPTTVYEGGTYHRLLGTTYTVHIVKG